MEIKIHSLSNKWGECVFRYAADCIFEERGEWFLYVIIFVPVMRCVDGFFFSMMLIFGGVHV